MRNWHQYVRENLALPRVDEGRTRDIEREVAADLEEVYTEAIAMGASEEEAEAKARSHIPDFQAFAREVTRAEQKRRRPPEDRWATSGSEAALRGGPRWAWAADLFQDLRYAFRSLRSSPGFTSVALLTLALGIGGVTTIFTLFDQVLLRPLPYPDSDELVVMWERMPAFGNAMVTYPNFLDWRARNRVYEDVAVWNDGSMNLTGSGDPVEITMARISASTFPILGVEPAMGRNFTPEEDRVGATPVVILTHGFWQEHFGGDPQILGKSVILDDFPHTIVGVMPRDVRFPPEMDEVDLYGPVEQFAAGWIDNRGSHPGLMALARLRPGVTIEAAREDMERVAVELEEEYPETNIGSRVHVASLQERVTRNAQDPLSLLLLSVGFILLIACMNVANLVLARTTARMQEMAVRASLGANRGRILRLLLTDSLLLWVCGGALGIFLARSGVRAVVGLLSEELPWVYQINLDLRVVGVALGVSLFTGLVFGLPTGLRVVRQDLKMFLKEGRRSTGGRERTRFRNGLVIAEVALAVALLIGAGLTLRSFRAMAIADPGLDVTRVLTAEVNLPGSRYPEEPDRTAFFTQLLDRVQTLPGVHSVATSYVVPMGPGGWQNAYHVEGTPPETDGEYAFAEVSSVSGDYFRTLGIPLRGREFTRRDNVDAPRVIIVDEAFAREYWPEEDPVGKKLKWGGYDTDNPWMEVVGVAGEVMVNGVLSEPRHQLYIPHWQDNDDGYWLLVKTRGEPLSLAEDIRREVLALDPSLPLGTVATMNRWAMETTRSARLTTLLMVIFSLAAVLLAAVGVYGVMAQMTAERRHEIGIRVALGARGDQVMGLVLRQGLITVGSGAILGLVLAASMGRVMSAHLYQISPTDPLTFALAPLLVVGIAVAANLLPARRAMGVDPVKALQAE